MDEVRLLALAARDGDRVALSSFLLARTDASTATAPLADGLLIDQLLPRLAALQAQPRR